VQTTYTIETDEFIKFKNLIYQEAGITLTEAKKSLVVTRLSKRLRYFDCSSFQEYYEIVIGNDYPIEMQMMVDLLTTNETYFFREEKHFEFLEKITKTKKNWTTPYRVWSAASSSGEEAYTIAMVLQETLGDAPWEIVGTDISTRIIEKAKNGLYPLERAEKIPKAYLNKYCLKGVRSHTGSFMIDKKLKKRIQFKHMNLLNGISGMGEFDAIFLRNVMIYFDQETKSRLVKTILNHLKPEGYFLIGHSESLNGISSSVKLVQPAVFQRK